MDRKYILLVCKHAVKKVLSFFNFSSLLLSIIRYDLLSCHNTTSIKGFLTLFISSSFRGYGLDWLLGCRKDCIVYLLSYYCLVKYLHSIVDSFCIGYPLMYLDRICIWPQPFFFQQPHTKKDHGLADWAKDSVEVALIVQTIEVINYRNTILLE